MIMLNELSIEELHALFNVVWICAVLLFLLCMVFGYKLWSMSDALKEEKKAHKEAASKGARLEDDVRRAKKALSYTLSFAEAVYKREVVPLIFDMVKARKKGNHPTEQAKKLLFWIGAFHLIFESPKSEGLLAGTDLRSGFDDTVAQALAHYEVSEEVDFEFKFVSTQDNQGKFPSTISAVVSWKSLTHSLTKLIHPQRIRVR